MKLSPKEIAEREAERLEHKVHGISVRKAARSYCAPVCIEPDSGTEDSLHLTLYLRAGAIVGVEVVDYLNPGEAPLVHGIGLVPGDLTAESVT